MKNTKLLILILVAALAGLGILKVGFDVQRQTEELMSTPVVKIQAQAKLIIDKEDPIEKQIDIQSGQTVFDLLEKSGVGFDYENYESGVFITSIEGISGPTKDWMYYVNKKLGRKAVDQKRISNGDVIEFKYQRSPF